MKKLVYNHEEHTVSVMKNMTDEGVVFCCPFCHADLIVLLDDLSAQEASKHPGVFCPNKHVVILVELQSRRKAMKELMDRMQEEYLANIKQGNKKDT